MARPPSSGERALGGIVASYVRANRTEPELRARLPDLYEYVRRRGLDSLSREELDREVLRHWTTLESAAEKVRYEAGLFNADRAVRPVRYRHGSAFCPACELYKDFHKECPSCGHLELTR